MAVLLDEGDAAAGVEGDDFGIVQADGGVAVRAGLHGFAAGEADVVHEEAGLAGDVEDLDAALMVQEAHGGRRVGILGGSEGDCCQDQREAEQQK